MRFSIFLKYQLETVKHIKRFPAPKICSVTSLDKKFTFGNF